MSTDTCKAKSADIFLNVEINADANQLILNDSQQKTASIDGLSYIAAVICRFAEIENLYLRDKSCTDATALAAETVKLYRSILEFQIRAICQFDRTATHQFARNVVEADGWTAKLDQIRSCEGACEKYRVLLDTNERRQGMERLESRLRDLDAEVQQRSEALLSELVVSREEQKGWKMSRVESECLETLRTVDYESDKSRIADRVKGTCKWFTTHNKYRSWLHETHSRLLWVTADPGCGKSVLSKFLVNNYIDNAAIGTTSICYFFFRDGSEKNQDGTNALCALLHQLFYQKRALIRHALPAFNHNRTKLSGLFETLWSIFLEAVMDAEAGSIICILDALDECGETTRTPLLKHIGGFFSDSPASASVKFVITSRPYTTIADKLWENYPNVSSVRLMGESERELSIIQKEISLVIAKKITKFREKRQQSNIHDETHLAISGQLSQIENRTYLWVCLIFPELDRNARSSQSTLLQIIKTIPSTVQEAYERILSSSTNPMKAKMLLHLVLAAQRPLSLREMNTALAITEECSSADDLDLEPEPTFRDAVRDLCGLFISVSDSKIYLIHQTAREFLLARNLKEKPIPNSKERWMYSMDLRISHLELAKKCLLYLHLSGLESEPGRHMSYFDSEEIEPGEIVSEANSEEVEPREIVSDADSEEIELGESVSDTYFGEMEPGEVVSEADSEEIEPREIMSDADSEEIGRDLIHSPISDEAFQRYALRAYSAKYWRLHVLQSNSVAVDSLMSLMLSITTRGSLAFENWTLNWIEENYIEGMTSSFHLTFREFVRMDQLSLAVTFRLIPVVTFLLKRGQPPIEDKSVVDRAATCAIWSCPDVFHMFLHKGLDLEAQAYRKSFLHEAAAHERVEAAQLLIEAGAAVNREDRDLREPLYFAARSGSQAMLSLLIESGARINHKDKKGETVLYPAIRTDDLETITYLLEHGAEYEVQNKLGETPLLQTMKYSIAELLISYGAKIDSSDCEGRSPLSYAAASNQYRDLISLLIDHGAQVDSRDRNGRTPFSYAVSYRRHGDSAIAAFLIEQGAQIETICNEMRTPLSHAAEHCLTLRLIFLIENGAAVNSSDWNGNTPLIWAAQAMADRMLPIFHIRDTIDLLLHKGANPITVNEDGESSLLILERLGPHRRISRWNIESKATKEKCEATKAEIKGLLRRYGAGETKSPTSSDTLSQVVALLTVNLIEIVTNVAVIEPRDHQRAVSSSAQLFRGWKLHSTVASVTLQDNRTIEQRITKFMQSPLVELMRATANSENSWREHTGQTSSSPQISPPEDPPHFRLHKRALLETKASEESNKYGGLPPSQGSENCFHYLHRLAELQQRLFNVNRCLYYIDDNPNHGFKTIDDLITKATGQQVMKLTGRRGSSDSYSYFGRQEDDSES